MSVEIIPLGSSRRFEIEAKLDGEPWEDATEAKLYLTKPSHSGGAGATLEFQDDAVETISPGVFRVVVGAGVLVPSGEWRRSWRVIEGENVQNQEPVLFRVIRAP